MRLCVTTPLYAILLLLACQPIVVRVGKRTQGTEAAISHSAAASFDPETMQSWNSVEDFLSHLDEIKKLGREALLKRYHENGRESIRDVFRRFRDAVAAEATRDGMKPLPYMNELAAGACIPLATRDIWGLEGYGDLKSLLETTFLSRIQPSEALPEPGVPGGMDDVTKLGFFELGIAIDGDAWLLDSPHEERQGADLRWKVIHEQNEAPEWAERDAWGVSFQFQRLVREHATHFTMSAIVGVDVYEGTSEGARPALALDFQKNLTAEGASEQIMLLETGLLTADGSWVTRGLSRRLVLTQDLALGHILHVTAIEDWQKPEAVAKKFQLDLDARRLCSELGDL